LLEAEVPLVRVGIPDSFWIQRVTPAKRERGRGGRRRERIFSGHASPGDRHRGGGGSRRERISSGNVSPRIVKPATWSINCDAAGVRGVDQYGSGLLGIWQLIKDSVCA